MPQAIIWLAEILKWMFAAIGAQTFGLLHSVVKF
jgi:hypothetical protein